jgi:hypothetical protein
MNAARFVRDQLALAPLQLAVFVLQLLQPLPLVRRQAGPLACAALGLAALTCGGSHRSSPSFPRSIGSPPLRRILGRMLLE